jgi:hypothetical protein
MVRLVQKPIEIRFDLCSVSMEPSLDLGRLLARFGNNLPDVRFSWIDRGRAGNPQAAHDPSTEAN